jgi:hypothetical protein
LWVQGWLRALTSGATAVQIVYSSHRGSRDIEHIGSAYDDAELELQIQAGPHIITAADLLNDDLRQALDHIHGQSRCVLDPAQRRS